MDGRPLRLGLLGAARITPTAILRPARALSEVEVVAIAARSPQRAAAFARRFGIPHVHDTYATLVADPTIEAVYIPLPNSHHARWTITALRAGKHVLCEKPLAANAFEAEQMTRAAQATGRVLMEAAHSRYHPLTARLKQILDQGEIGQPQYYEGRFRIPLLRPGDIRYRYALAGGALMDTGCYPIQLIRFLAGAEPEVTAARARRSSARVDRETVADLRFADGRTGRIICSLLAPRLFDAGLRVVGERGVLQVVNPYLPHYFHWITVRGPHGTRRERVSGASTYYYQLQAFVRATRGEPTNWTDGANGVATMRVIDAAYRAAGMHPRGI